MEETNDIFIFQLCYQLVGKERKKKIDGAKTLNLSKRWGHERVGAGKCGIVRTPAGWEPDGKRGYQSSLGFESMPLTKYFERVIPPCFCAPRSIMY